MAILDIILLVCFVPAIVVGLSKGFIKQLVDMVSIIVGAWAAFKFSQLACDWLQTKWDIDPKLLYIICFVVIVVAAVLVLNLIGNAICKVIKVASLGWFNRLLGLIFGIFKTALILGLLIILFDDINEKWQLVAPDKLEDAVVYDWIKNFADTVFPYLKNIITGSTGGAVEADV